MGRRALVERGALVGVLLLVADDEDGRGRGVLGVVREFFESAQLLGLPDDHHLPGAHHGHLAAEVHHLSAVRVAAVDGELVEGPLCRVEDRLGQQVGQGVDEVALLAHEQVEGGEATGPDVGREALVGGCRVAEFQGRFGHQTISLVMRSTFSVDAVRR